MTDSEKQFIEGVKQMEEQAPGVGLCSMPFRMIREELERVYKERDELVQYRTPAAVQPRKGYAGKCPSCGVVFLDDSTGYCGNCGQALKWGKNDAAD